MSTVTEQKLELVESGSTTWMNDQFELKIEFERYWVIKPNGEKSICYAERNGHDCPIVDTKSGIWWCLESGIWKKVGNFTIECNL